MQVFSPHQGGYFFAVGITLPVPSEPTAREIMRFLFGTAPGKRKQL
jgi:hypothetical protein